MAVQNAMFGDCSDSNTLFESLDLANNEMMFSYPTYGWNPYYESSAGNLPEGGMSSGYCFESMHLEDGCTDGSLAAAPGLVYATPVDPLQPWTYALGAQPMLQQDLVLENGDYWGVASVQCEPSLAR
ncbi:hypothetical protein CKAH01_16833 [Colletotrichum kahawae]|uniref:Uncharacterized protein n=1 Tax=Colletotrichum kahawae TaxID=34407 RepID=A0AAE0D7V1_COLKA|nr:hypothetical protein CKAH01_16833 [Colletotrichum kahawae]